MAVGRINKTSVESIPLPVGTARAYLWDDKLKGFGCMVTSKASRSYIVQYQMGGRGKATQRVTIGRHGSPWTAEKARERATDILELIRKGINPVEKARADRAAGDASKAEAERLAFSKYVELFERRYLDANGLRSADDIKAIFKRDFTPYFKDKPINALRREDIANRLDAIGERSQSSAVKSYRWLRKLMSWAAERGDLAASPMESMRPPYKDGRRKRVLTGKELKAVWLASDEIGEPHASFVKMLILTGQRLREVAGMRWSEIDLDAAQWLMRGERTKNARDHICPLSPQAIDILIKRFPRKADRRGPIFSTNGKVAIAGFSKAKAQLDAKVTAILGKLDDSELPIMQPWVFHDLRRSFSTGCQALGFPIEHTEACLNHVSGKRGGLAAIYQLHEYLPEKVAVMAAWGRHVEALMSNQPGNIVELQSRARG